MSDMNELLRKQIALTMEETINGLTEGASFAGTGTMMLVDKLSAAEASAPASGLCIAAHVEHMAYGMDAFAAAMAGDTSLFDNWPPMDPLSLSEEEWKEIRIALKSKTEAFMKRVNSTDFDQSALRLAMGNVAHAVYHLGIIQVKFDVLKGND